jgi:hypothetical protein
VSDRNSASPDVALRLLPDAIVWHRGGSATASGGTFGRRLQARPSTRCRWCREAVVSWARIQLLSRFVPSEHEMDCRQARCRCGRGPKAQAAAGRRSRRERRLRSIWEVTRRPARRLLGRETDSTRRLQPRGRSRGWQAFHRVAARTGEREVSSPRTPRPLVGVKLDRPLRSSPRLRSDVSSSRLSAVLLACLSVSASGRRRRSGRRWAARGFRRA